MNLYLTDELGFNDSYYVHEDHSKGYLAQSKTYPKVKLYCCDNCGAHHWGEYVVYKGFEYTEYDFDYQKPNGEPYRCPAKLHYLRGGPEYCMGACWPCKYARKNPNT